MKRMLVFACAYFSCIYIQGQQQNEVLKKVNIASPTAAAIGKYVDIPVSYHTGVPNISIPIHAVKDGAIEVPISLSYHASGIKLSEVSGWVGLGWSLNAGGVISRSVNGLPDDKASLSSQTHGHFSEYGYNNYLYNGSPSVNNIDDAGFLNGYKDSEPDLFNFNFNGYSGKFYFRDDRTPILVPQQDIKIIPGLTNNIHITSFTIITPDGLKYEFGKTTATNDTDPIEQTNVLTPSNPAINQNTISSWYLNKITNPSSSKSVTLIYEEEKYTHYNVSMPQLDGTDENGYDHSLIKNAIKGVRLKQIVFSAGVINFNAGSVRTDIGGYVTGEDFYTESANTEGKSLGNIEVTDGGTTCKKFVFSYDYIEDNINNLPPTLSIGSINNDRKRLRLLSVSEKNCDYSLTNNTTSFNYFTEALPRRLSFALDHWGFNNGVVSNNKVTSQYTTDTFNVVAGANREPQWPQMRAGSLKEIIYPTGGKTEFEFEPHNTWVSSTKFNENFVFSMQMGFDGGSTTIVQYQTLNANYHKFTINNTVCPPGYEYWVTCLSSLRIFNASNQEVFYMTVPVGTSQSKVAYLPQGTYRFELFKDKGSYTGTGCVASTYAMPSYTHNRNETVGGLRIKSIKQSDNINANPLVTNYSYDYANLQSAGVLYSRPAYVQVIRNDQAKLIGIAGAAPCSPNGCINCDVGNLYYKKSGSPLVPMKNTQGNHIGYSQVKVTKEGNGYSIYKFFGSELWENLHDDIAYKNVNLKPPCPADIPNWPAPPVPFEYKRGELKEEQYFNQAGNILSEKWYSYIYEDVAESYTPARIILYAIGGGNGRATDYSLKSKKKTSTEVTDRTYNLVNSTIISTSSISYFESPFHSDLTRGTSTNSKGETVETKYKYASDYFNGTCQAISNCYQTYASDLAYHTGNYQIALQSCQDYACKWNVYQTYRVNCSQIRVNYLNCRATNFNNTPNAYDDCMTNAIASADAVLKPVYWLKKSGRNPLIETTSWKANKLTEAVFYKYDFLNGSTNQIYVKNIDKINLSSPSSAFQVSDVSGNTIVRDSRYENDAELKTSDDNLLQVINGGNNIESYIWGYNQQYPVAIIIGKTYDDAISQSGLNMIVVNNPASEAALRTELGKLRTLSGVLVKTFTYKPLIGVSTETDANGRTIYYEYDAFNRLVFVRDKDNNIVRKICYNYAGQPENCSSACTNTTPNWQNTTTALRCQLNGSSQNTGYQEQEQKDLNPCSPTYNQTQWIVTGYNTTACPLPSGCTPSNCTGNDKKCINGVCETGVWSVINSIRVSKTVWQCTWAYCFSDGSYSTYTEVVNNSTFCMITCFN